MRITSLFLFQLLAGIYQAVTATRHNNNEPDHDPPPLQGEPREHDFPLTFQEENEGATEPHKTKHHPESAIAESIMSTRTSEIEPTVADAGLSETTSPPLNHEDENDAGPASSFIPSAAPICPLCYDEDSTSTAASTVILSVCQHHSCMTCFVRWTNEEECSGRTAGPTCPFCRIVISDDDVVRVLGRPFQPRKAINHAEVPTNDEVDEFTLHWINEHTVPCAMCGYRIEKSDGCDKVECLCGYRFCYRCGAANGICDCNPGHVFLDEHQDVCIHDAPLRDVNGRIDLRLCIRRREVRLKRSDQYAEEEIHWHYAMENPSLCTFNGRWIFSAKNSSRCIAMLTQQLGHESIMLQRLEQKASRSRAEEAAVKEEALHDIQNASWLFLRRGADTKAMHQLVVGVTREERRGQRESNYDEMIRFSNWENEFWYYKKYRKEYDRLLKSGGKVPDYFFNYFSKVLDEMEDLTMRWRWLWGQDWCDREPWYWSEIELPIIWDYRMHCCRCRNLRPFIDCGFLASFQECDCDDGIPDDLAYVMLRKMTGASRKRTRRGTTRKSSKKSSRSKPSTRWKRTKAQLAWSQD